MKKRIFSLFLTLAIFCGMLPPPVQAAQGDEPGTQDVYAEPAQTQPETRSQTPLAAGSARASTTKFELMPRTNFKVTTQTAGIRSRFGKDLSGNGKAATLKLSEMPTVGQYDGYQPENDNWSMFTNDDTRHWSRWNERAQFKNSDIIYIPFKVEVTVPAYTEYTLKLKPGASVQRNSKGGAGYYVEIFDWGTSENTADITFMTGDTNQPSPNDHVIKRNDGGRVYGNTNSGPIGGSYTLDPVVVRNAGASSITYTRYFGILAGVGASGSALKSYHHQMTLNAHVSILYTKNDIQVSQSQPVAEVNGTAYDSIDKAVADFNDEGNGATLKLLKDITNDNIFNLSNDGGTVDLNGKTWMGMGFKVGAGSSGTFTIQNGTLSGVPNTAAQFKTESFLSTFCPVILNAVVLDCQYTNRGISSSGDLTITGGKVTNAKNGVYLLSGNANINGGAEIDGVNNGVIEASNHIGNVTISNATIKGSDSGSGVLHPVSSAAANVWTISNDVKLERRTGNTVKITQIYFGTTIGTTHSLIQFDGKPAAGYIIDVPDPGSNTWTLTTGLTGVSNVNDYLCFKKDPYPGVAMVVDGNGQIAVRRAIITFDPVGGTLSESDKTRSANWDGTVSNIPTPTFGNRAFAGWWMEDGTAVSRKTVFSGDTTVTARWKGQSITVTFDNGDDTSTTKQVTCGEAYGTLPVPTRAGYTFDGWSTAENGGGSEVTAETVVGDDAEDQTLYAKWTANTYIITLDPMGGNIDGENKKTVTFGENYPELPVLNRDYYAFIGWYPSTGTEPVTAETKVTRAGNHTLYAKWGLSVPVTVTLEYRNGSEDGTLHLMVNGRYDGLPVDPKRDGYTFDGWYTSLIGGERVARLSVVTDPSDHTLYAHWTPKKYIVHFDLGGVEGTPPEDKTVEHGKTVTKPADPTPPAGYAFKGWAGPDGLWNFNAHVTKNLTLTAVWEEYVIVPNVKLDPNGGKVYGSTEQVAYNGFVGSQYGRLPTPVNTGYAFAGWYTEKDGGTYVDSETPVQEGEVILYAHWTRLTYQVKFDARGGTFDSEVSPITVNYGGSITGTLPVPTKENYTFAGWENGGVMWSDASAWDSGRTVTRNLTLSAKWVGNSCTITFNAGDDATVDPASMDVIYGEPCGKLPVPTRASDASNTFQFLGWFTAQTNGTQITATSIVNGNMTLYAHWKKSHEHKLGESDTGSEVTFEPWNDSTKLPTESANSGKKYYLTTDVTVKLSSQINNEQSLTICLNGHTIKYEYDPNPDVWFSGFMIGLNGTNAKLTICDCTGAGKIDGDGKACVGVMACPNSMGASGGTFKLYGGTITGCGHGVAVGGQVTFDMYGGTITGNRIDGRSVSSNNSTPRGGLAQYDKFKQNGAGVYVQGADSYSGANGTIFNMYGGEISGNSALDGAGVYVVSGEKESDKETWGNKTKAKFNMTGGSITGNTSGTAYDKNGNSGDTKDLTGGVFLENCTVTLGGTAKISGNTGLNGVRRNLFFDQNIVETSVENSTEYIDKEPSITVNALEKGAEIGVSTDPVPVPGQLIPFATAGTDYSAYFFSDAAECSIVHQDKDKTINVIGNNFEEHTHKVCGAAADEECSHADTKHPTAQTYQPLERLKNNGIMQLAGGNYVLTTDLDYKYLQINAGSTVNLCLNGHTLKGLDTTGGVIRVYYSATLNICDCSAEHTGVITGGNQGGVATSGTGTETRTVNMYGGTITGNTSANGGGVYAHSESSTGRMDFNMYGGEISGNTATTNGGGVYVTGTSTFTMRGGTIANNTATNQGGGIHCANNTSLYGGIITGNTATGNGGGVYTSKNMTIEGRIVIKGNTVGAAANNLYLNGSRLVLKKDSPLEDGSSIGVSVSNAYKPTSGDPTCLTANQTADNQNVDEAMVDSALPYFFSDLTDYSVAKIKYAGDFYLGLSVDGGGSGGGGGTLPTKKTFTIIFDDGSDTPKTLETDENGKLTGQTLPEPVKPKDEDSKEQTGIVFDGWYKDGEKVEDPKNETFTGDTILEAVWKDCDHANASESSESKDATCLEGGKTSYKCPECNAEWSVNSEPLGHDWSGNWTNDEGNDQHVKTCQRDGCNEQMTASHNWEKSGTSTPNCETGGTQSYECSECHATKQEDLPATGHVWGAWEADSDENHKRTCSVCGKAETEGHGWTESVTTEPSCSAEGEVSQTCAICGMTATQTLDKLPHTYDANWTDSGDGKNHKRTCTICRTETETEPHEWDAGAVTTDPTETTEGVRTYTCLVCNATKTEAIPSTGSTSTVNYIVSYDGGADDVTGVPAAEIRATGTTFTLASAPVRKGYNFTGWGVAEDETYKTCAEGDSYTMPGWNLVFTAQWELHLPVTLGNGDSVTLPDGTKIERSDDGGTVTITPPTDEPDGPKPTEITVDPGDEVTIKEDTRTEENPDGGTTETKRVVVEIPGGSTVQTGDGPTVKIPEDVPTVKVELDGTIIGLPEGTEITDKDGNKITTETEGGSVSNQGDVTFPDGGKATITDGDGNKTEIDIPKAGEDEEPVEISPGEIKKKYTVTFDTQGHGTCDPQTVMPGTTVTKPQDPTAEGYSFEGWYLRYENAEESGDIEKVWNFETDLVAGDMTLYARWSGDGHQHSWSDKWSHDDDHHWHDCTVDGCPAENPDKEGYGPHTYPDEYQKDENFHWKECVCGSTTEKTPHSYDGDNPCVCGQEKPASGHTHEWGDWRITKAPTLTEKGTAERVCRGDSTHRETVELPVLTDTSVWTPSEDDPDTYTSEYGSVTVGHEHHWGDWSITVEPTETETGEAERSCIDYAIHKDTVELPVLTDTSVWTPGKRVEPGENTPGSQEYVSEYGTVTIPVPPTGPVNPPPTGKVPLGPGEEVTTEDGTTVKRDDDGGTVTIDRPGEPVPDIVIHVPTPPTDNDVTVDTGTGRVDVPDDSTVDSGEGKPDVKLPDGGSVDPDGGVIPSPGGSVEIGGDGKPGTTITPPNGDKPGGGKYEDEDRKVTPDEDGTVDAPGGSTVSGGDGRPDVKLPDGGKVDPDDGGVTPPPGSSVVIGGGDGNPDITVTPPSGGGDGDRKVTPGGDGKVDVPGDSSVKPGGSDDVEIRTPGGGKVDPDDGSVTSNDKAVVNDTAITPPDGSSTVTTDRKGNTPVGPGSTAEKGEGDNKVTVKVIEGTAVVDKDGNVNFPDGDGKVEIKKGNHDASTLDVPRGGSVPTDSGKLNDVTISVLERDENNTPVQNADVELRRGVKTMASGKTGADGTYIFHNIPYGAYNIVARKDAKTKTQLVTVDAKTARETLYMPSENVNSVLNVEQDENAGTSGEFNAARVEETVVGGLDEEAEETKKQFAGAASVTVSMTVKKEGALTAQGADKIREIAAAASAPIIEFLAITVERSIEWSGAATETTGVSETSTILEIVVPFNFAGKQNVTVYRHHDNRAEPLRALGSRLERPAAEDEGKFWADDTNHLIYIYARKFSTYAIGYNQADHSHSYSGTYQSDENGHWQVCSCGDVKREDHRYDNSQDEVCDVCGYRRTVSKPSGGGSSGGGDGGPSGYPPVIAKTTHGSVTVSPQRPVQGDRVTVTLTPDAGYRIRGISITDAKGDPVDFVDNGDGTYSFLQPNGRVTIRAEFLSADGGSGAGECPKDGTCPIAKFTDASPTAWYHDGVHYCLDMGMMRGYGNGVFRPDSNVTRAEAAQILYNREGKPEVDSGSALFHDVPTDMWCFGAVSWGQVRGVLKGYSDGRFGPGDSITREQLAAVIWRYAGSPAAEGELAFTDSDKIAVYARDAVRWAVQNGIISGYNDGSFGPGRPATRAETAVMLARFFGGLG